MTNLTLVINDEVLHRARVRATTEGTSVNAEVREFIQRYADSDDLARKKNDATQWLVDLSMRSPTGGLEGRTWVREDLHER